MNPNGFILEVPAELRMRRKQRKEEDIMMTCTAFGIKQARHARIFAGAAETI